jgi:hypothetical protein
MIAVRLVLKLNQAPLKRVPITLTDADWEVNRFLRSRFAVGGFQASARDRVQQFRRA